MSCGPILAHLIVAVLIIVITARTVARRVSVIVGPPPFPVLLITILITLVVLQAAAQLPVLAGWIVEQRGGDPNAVCEGQLPMIGFISTLISIFAYALTFFLTWRKARA
ncbi:MAG: hypothetical protein ACRBCL_06305 [Maritimibacter sp.]